MAAPEAQPCSSARSMKASLERGTSSREQALSVLAAAFKGGGYQAMRSQATLRAGDWVEVRSQEEIIRTLER